MVQDSLDKIKIKQAYQREYYKQNKEKFSLKDKEYYIKNREKILARQKTYRQNNKEKVQVIRRTSRRKTTFGITTEQFNELENKQNGVCAICKKKNLRRTTKDLHIDHNHITNKIRGLLCHNCNTGLGLFKENIELLLIAVQYLRDNNS
jgi:hypothetical protein